MPMSGFTFMRPVRGLDNMDDMRLSLCETMSSMVWAKSSLLTAVCASSLFCCSRTNATSATTSCSTESFRIALGRPSPGCAELCIFLGGLCGSRHDYITSPVVSTMPIHLKVSGSGYTPITSPGAADPEVRKLREREAFLNELSAWISVVALAVLLLDESALLFEFTTWQTFLPTARNETTVRRMQDFATGLENTCDVAKLDIAHVEFVTKINRKHYTYFAMPLAYE